MASADLIQEQEEQEHEHLGGGRELLPKVVDRDSMKKAAYPSA